MPATTPGCDYVSDIHAKLGCNTEITSLTLASKSSLMLYFAKLGTVGKWFDVYLPLQI